MTDDEDLQLVPGSTYRVQSVGHNDALVESQGEFKGFLSLSSGQGLVLELGEDHGDLAGKQRIIPVHMLLTIDILEAAEPEEEEEESHIHYS